MRTMRFEDAAAEFSALLDAAEHGEATSIMRDSKIVAVLTPPPQLAGSASQPDLKDDKRPNFVEFLMTFPGGLEDLERDQSTLRTVDF